ncbi:MAG TPA: 50S ribosomal protein L19e [Candidatus Norongarragalinales archaeon]|jgi:large subunit ribosomal protein L19e|nr:50S ribosomal protein L19e [Candidatus Norongarragalinales archaeon]
MSLQTVRRIAADQLNCGESRVRILDTQKALEALTRDDVRALIQTGTVVKLAIRGVNRSKAELKEARKHEGRRRGKGSKKGTPNARLYRKDRWMSKVRAQRNLLQLLAPKLENGAYRRAYSMIKGGAFKDRKHLLTFLQENKLVRQ